MDERRTPEVYAFGPFLLDVPERLLTRARQPVPLRAKVFDTLVVLVRHAGRLVTREELIAAVWPDAIVEEGNLSHNVSALRKALGEEGDALYVETVPRSGYRFIHPLEGLDEPPRAAAEAPARARRFLAQGAWREAYEAFLEASRTGALAAVDREGLAEAARWCGLHDELVPLLEDAVKAWVEEGEPVHSAHASLELAAVLLDRRRIALAKSYARQAERRLPAEPTASGPALREHARLRRLRARFCWWDADWEGALEQARSALALARSAEDLDAETMAAMDVVHTLLALERFAEALALLDEIGALVTGGRLTPYTAGMTHCGLIIAWQALGRPERALEWSQAYGGWSDASGVAYFSGLCRVHHGELVGLRGDLARAEEVLQRGTEELARAHSLLAGAASRELGSVRLRRGDLAGAEAAFSRALKFGTDPQPGYALLRAARGEALQARRDLERFLSSEGSGQTSLLERQNGLGALGAHVRLCCETGAPDEARATVARMDALASATGSRAHRALADAAHGELALADGNGAEALARLSASWRAWTELGAPFEAATVRARLGEARLSEGDLTRARLELEGAAEAFAQLGAAHELERVRRRLAGLASRAPRRPERVRVCGTIARAAELRAFLGEDAWHELITWLDRKLQRCWSDHDGRPMEHGQGRWVVDFDGREGAEACMQAMRTSLREHRAAHGFAPEIVVEVSDGAPS